MKAVYDWKEKINNKELQEVVDTIKNDGLVLVPTETVYGIGANAYSDEACKKVYEAKGRASDNPLIVHVSNKEMISKIAEKPNEVEEKLIDSFMPGPFTLILNKKCDICDTASAGMKTIGIRMPDSKIIHEIIEKSQIPMAAPSANISGRPSGTCIEDIIEELKDKIDIAIDGGKSKIGIESTIVKVIDSVPTILRPGFVTEEDIYNAVGKVKLSDNLFKKIEKNEKVESPGMKYRHYAPKARCILIESSQNQVQEVNDLLERYFDCETNQISNNNAREKTKCTCDVQKDICVIGFNEDKNLINIDEGNFISLGSKYNLEEISQNVFTSLRKVDKLNSKVAIVEGVEKSGLGLSIMNRLARACEN